MKPISAAAMAGAFGFAACSSSGSVAPNATDAGFVCPPGANCTPMCAAMPGCVIDEAKCGSKSTCLPMASNQGRSVQDFRMRRVRWTAPRAFVQPFFQQGLTDQNVSLAATSCAELGDGGFSWLLRVDRGASSLKTGGASPASDPFGVGYCFDARTDALPQTTPITITGETFDAAPIASLALPVYAHGSVSESFLLPMRQLALHAVKISSGGDCIGSFNASALDATCGERPDCEKWQTDGSFSGFITLEDADKIAIQALGQKSLCVLLTASTPGADGMHCKRDANGSIAFKGDYCSTTKTPEACADSYWTAATFAASAAKICP